MNTDQVAGIFRAIVPALVAYAVGRGWLSEGAAGDVTAAALAIGAAIWSVLSNRPGKTIA